MQTDETGDRQNLVADSNAYRLYFELSQRVQLHREQSDGYGCRSRCQKGYTTKDTKSTKTSPHKLRALRELRGFRMLTDESIDRQNLVAASIA